MWRSVNSAIAGADVERKQEVPDAADAPLADEMIVDPASPPTALPAGDRAALARRLRPYGIMLGVMFVLFILSDYLFRPTFVSINVDSDETSRPTPWPCPPSALRCSTGWTCAACAGSRS